MTGDIKKLIESVESDIVLADMLYQWANTPTSKTAAITKGWTPNHELIKNNIGSRYKIEKEKVQSDFEKFKKIVEDSGFNFASGYLDATEIVNSSVELNSLLQSQTLSRLAAASSRDGKIAWLYSKLYEQCLQFSWYSHYPGNSNEILKEPFKKFGDIFTVIFSGESAPTRFEILKVLVYLGFINELDWISATHRDMGIYEFSVYLKDIANNIDKYVNVKGTF